MAVTLDQFRAAAKTGGKIRFIGGSEEKGLHATGSPWNFWRVITGHRNRLRHCGGEMVREFNRQAATAFVNVVGDAYGPSGRQLASARLNDRIDQGEPLRGRDVEVVLRDADRMLQGNIRNNEEIAGRICTNNPRDEYGFGWLLTGTSFNDTPPLDQEVRRTLRRGDLDRIRDEIRRYLLENEEAGDGGRNRLNIQDAYHEQARPKLRELAIRNQNRRIRELFSRPGQAGYDLVFGDAWNESNMPQDLDPSEVDYSRLPGKVSSAIDALVINRDGIPRPVPEEAVRRAVGEKIRPFLADLKGRLDGIEGAFEGERITEPQRAALREIALRYHDAPCDLWTVLERTGNDWTGRGRLAELILEIMGDPPENRDRAEQALTACRFFTQASFGHYLFASDAMGLLTSGYDLSKVEVRRGQNGTDLLIDIGNAVRSPVAFHMTARVDPEGACRIEAFDLARNLRREASLFQAELLNELNELTDPKTVLREKNLASDTFRDLFAGFGRNYLETLEREVMVAVAPLLEHPPGPEDLPAVQEYREGIAAAVIRVIADSVNRMPPEIRGILAGARGICDRYAARFENIWRSVIENMILLRGIVPMAVIPIVESLMPTDPQKGTHVKRAAQIVERCLAGRFPEGEGLGALEAVRNEAEGFLDAVSRVGDH